MCINSKKINMRKKEKKGTKEIKQIIPTLKSNLSTWLSEVFEVENLKVLKYISVLGWILGEDYSQVIRFSVVRFSPFFFFYIQFINFSQAEIHQVCNFHFEFS